MDNFYNLCDSKYAFAILNRALGFELLIKDIYLDLEQALARARKPGLNAGPAPVLQPKARCSYLLQKARGLDCKD